MTNNKFTLATASVGATIDLKLTDGKAAIVFSNREALPISISVFRK